MLLPLLLCGYLGWEGAIDLENLIYLWIGMAVLYVFVAVVGLHCGMIYENSRTAIATSLGTVFFLFLGVATCMRIMVAFSGSFNVQLGPFVALMVGGWLGAEIDARLEDRVRTPLAGLVRLPIGHVLFDHQFSPRRTGRHADRAGGHRRRLRLHDRRHAGPRDL